MVLCPVSYVFAVFVDVDEVDDRWIIDIRTTGFIW